MQRSAIGSVAILLVTRQSPRMLGLVRTSSHTKTLLRNRYRDHLEAV